jgi:hypothetical protein
VPVEVAGGPAQLALYRPFSRLWLTIGHFHVRVPIRDGYEVRVTNEVTVPLLPCASIDDIVAFYEVLGFHTTWGFSNDLATRGQKADHCSHSLRAAALTVPLSLSG